jgi:hypothetical protein
MLVSSARKPSFLARPESTFLLVLLAVAGCDGGTVPKNPVPAIEHLAPVEVDQGSPQLTLTVRGTGFSDGSTIRLNGSERPTRFVSATELEADLPPQDFWVVGAAQVVVVSPAPGGGTSNVALLQVRPGANPYPLIKHLEPAQVKAGVGEVTIEIVGEHFTERSRVSWNNVEKAATYVTPGLLTVTLSESETAAGGSHSIRVYTEGAGTSAAATFSVLNPMPVVEALSTPGTTAGEDSLVLSVTGAGFVSSSRVRFAGRERPTRLVFPGVLEAILSAEDLKAAGTFAIQVWNPAPAGGESESLSFTISYGVPNIELLPSRGASAGRSGFELFVHGSGFADGSVVRWNGRDLPTRFISGRRLAASVSAADVVAPGTVQITVHTPAPGGRSSDPVSFSVRPVGAATVADVKILPLVVRDLVSDPVSERIFVSVSSPSSALANSVAVVDPRSGEITASVSVGSGPNRLAQSSDGSYLYVGLDGVGAVRRVDLRTLTADLQWSLPSSEVAGDLVVAPEQPTVVAVARHRLHVSPSLAGVTIYDDGAARPRSSAGHTGADRIEFLSSSSNLYGFNNSGSGFRFYTVGVDLSGARHLRESPGLISGYYTDIIGAPGRIYGTDGSVVDAERHERVGSLGRSGSALAVDAETGRAFLIGEAGIHVYDLNNFQLLGTIPITGYNFGHPANARVRLVRWGADGLAFRDQDRLFVVRSPIVAR